MAGNSFGAVFRYTTWGESHGAAIGCVVRGDTYHFEIVASESARGVMDVALEFGIPVANGILTTDTEAQAEARLDKGAEAVRVAVEMARLRAGIADASR